MAAVDRSWFGAQRFENSRRDPRRIGKNVRRRLDIDVHPFYSTHVRFRQRCAMPFAIVLTLVVLVSSMVLLYQFVSGAMAQEAGDGADAADAPAPFPVERPAFHAQRRIDSAA
jgi:hypothetical protein